MWNKVISNTFVLMDKYREFLRTIQFLWFTKIILSLVSISAGYFYIYSLFIKLFYMPKLAGFFSIVILSALEAVNFYLPMKYFKFAMNPYEALKEHNYFNIEKVKRFLLISALFGFGVSFYLSAQGAKYFLNYSADQTKAISAWYQTALKSIDSRYYVLAQNFAEEKAAIEQNPTVYKSGGHQPTMLSAMQLKRVANINEQLIGLDKRKSADVHDLKEEYKKKLKTNSIGISKEGWKYFLFAGFLILTLNIVNYFIVYFSKVVKLSQDEGNEFKELRKWRSELKKQALLLAENDVRTSMANLQAVTAQGKKTPADVHKNKVPDFNSEMWIKKEAKIDTSEEIALDDLNFEKVLKKYAKNVYAKGLLEKYPEASKLLIQREKDRRDGNPQTTIKEIEAISEVGKTTLYKILSILNFK